MIFKQKFDFLIRWSCHSFQSQGKCVLKISAFYFYHELFILEGNSDMASASDKLTCIFKIQ
uniref:Uncharacterized protein n=1 Tax=Anguilla anguilla TaxID=7936 RepID=A0A0E9XZ29_ANGAN